MRMPAHRHANPLKQIFGVMRMQRIDQRVLRAFEVVKIVPLHRLIEKRQADQQYRESDNRELSAAPQGFRFRVRSDIPGKPRETAARRPRRARSA